MTPPEEIKYLRGKEGQNPMGEYKITLGLRSLNIKFDKFNCNNFNSIVIIYPKLLKFFLKLPLTIVQM